MTDLNKLAMSALSKSYLWIDSRDLPCQVIIHTDEWVLLKRHNGDEEAWPLENGAKDHFLLNFHFPTLL